MAANCKVSIEMAGDSGGLSMRFDPVLSILDVKGAFACDVTGAFAKSLVKLSVFHPGVRAVGDGCDIRATLKYDSGLIAFVEGRLALFEATTYYIDARKIRFLNRNDWILGGDLK